MDGGAGSTATLAKRRGRCCCDAWNLSLGALQLPDRYPEVKLQGLLGSGSRAKKPWTFESGVCVSLGLAHSPERFQPVTLPSREAWEHRRRSPKQIRNRGDWCQPGRHGVTHRPPTGPFRACQNWKRTPTFIAIGSSAAITRFSSPVLREKLLTAFELSRL